jgi:hypothetical protein
LVSSTIITGYQNINSDRPNVFHIVSYGYSIIALLEFGLEVCVDWIVPIDE